MVKDIFFASIMLLIGAALSLLDYVGMSAHIAISILGVLVLAVYTAVTRKNWKIPALEILMRLCYGIALISGIVLMKVRGVPALGIGHKISATLFIAFLVVLVVIKIIAIKKSK